MRKIMTNIYRLGRVLVLIGIAGLMAYSQEKGSEYVAPSEAAPRGKAPEMQVQCLNPGDLQNAGAHWMDQEVIVDGNLVSSRKPDDIPAFNREMLRLLSQVKRPAGRVA